MASIRFFIVRHKLPLTFAIVAAGILAAALAVYLLSLRVNRASLACFRAMQVELVLDDTRYLIGRAEAGHRGYLRTGDTHYLGDYQAAARRITEKIDALDLRARQGEAPPEQIDRLTRLIRAKLAEFSRTISLRSTQGAQTAAALALSTEDERTIDEIGDQFDTIRTAMEAEYAQRAEARDLATTLRTITCAASAAASIVFLGWAYCAIRRAVRALGEQRRKQQENEARLQAIFHKAALGIVEIDRDDLIIESNDRFCQMLDFTCQELRGQNIHDLTAPGDRAQSRRLNADLREDGQERIVYESRYLKRDCSPVWVRMAVNSLRDDTGGWLGAIGTAEDITARKRAEELLQLRESYLRSIIENQPGLVWLKDEKGRFLTVNTAFGLSCGRKSPEDLVGKTDLDIWPKELAERYQADDAKVIQGGKPLSVEEPIFDRGQTTWFETFKTPVYDETGKVIGTTGYARDITERKAAEAALRDSERRFRTMADLIPQLAWIANADGFIVWYNRRWYEYTGTTSQQMEGWGWQRVHDPEVLPSVLERWKASIASGTPFDMEFPLRGGDGKFRQFLTRGWPLKDDQGRVIQWFGTNTDVSERAAAEAAIKASEVRYRRLFESAKDGILILDADTGLVVDVNPFLIETLGLSREVFLGKKVWELGFFKNIVANQDRFKELKEKEYLRYEDLPLETQDGRKIDVEFVSNLYRVNHHKVIQCNIRDITERKRAEDALRRTAEEMARSNKELEQFAYIASHDLQEPLRQVRAFVQILRDRHADKFEGKAAEYFQFVYDGAARMSDLVRGLLDYSRAGAKEKPRSPISCQKVVGAVLANLQASIAEAHARITHDDLPTVKAEPTQLTQLFQNLIANAIKFRRDGVAPEIHVGCRRDRAGWLFSVRDNGIGIDPEYYEKVFVIFQRLHGPQKYAGTGIGLAICKKIVEQYGGKIWIESKADEGSTFYFTLPEAAS